MLKTRVITAVILLLLFFVALYVDAYWPFQVIVAGFVALAIWEWLRLTMARRASPHLSLGLQPKLMIIGVGVVLMLLARGPGVDAASIEAFWKPIWLAATVIWLLIISPWLLLRASPDSLPRKPVLASFGVFACVAAYGAVLGAYSQGAWFMLSLMALVWFADIAAYFAGRRWGRAKLAPRLSPGKTWAGAFGGLAAALAWTAFTALPSVQGFGAVLVDRWGWPMAMVLAAVLTALSIIGDLFESLLKRRAGRKDSSRLLPGHGGVLDRIDALLPVMPAALVLSM